jgi:hypothetical protein
MLPALIHLKSKNTGCGCQWKEDVKNTKSSEEANGADDASSSDSDDEDGVQGK